ncbi:hypothetical protein V8E53_002170 [Lactarius tabidus]
MYFLSVEPQSRVVLENHSNTLLAQFDSQLRIIANRYLAFFRERRAIEAFYVNSLRRLHDKAQIADASFDPRAEPSTTREAWEKVRDSIEKEANAKQAFVHILDVDVIEPLATFKDTTDRTRKRIEGDLQQSTAMYVAHVESQIPKLQLAYFKKTLPRFGGQQDDSDGPGPAKSKDVDDSEFRSAVGLLNTLRSRRAENLGDGYDCLEEIVFTPITKNVINRYMDGIIPASAKYDNLVIKTRVEVENVLAKKDTSESDLRASFRRVLSSSIPPPTFYRSYCPSAHSDLIFGGPLVDLETNQDNVSKVMRFCMEEVEKRGLDTRGIYLTGYSVSEEVLQLRQRLESEPSFSFRSTDNIHFVAMLLIRYLLDLPEPLFALSLQDYRNYKQIRAKYAENDFLLLRTKIRELHLVHRASLGALLRHLLHVASHSDTNTMTVEKLAARFQYAVLSGNEVLQDGVHIKGLVLEDLIRNVHALFDDQPSTSPPALSPAAETASTFPSGSLLSAELLQPSEVDAMGSPTVCRGLVGVAPTFTQSSLSFLHSNVALGTRLTPSPTALPSTRLGLLSSNTPLEGVETSSHGQVIPEVRGTEAVGPEALVNSVPLEDVSVLPTSVTEWQLRQSQLLPQPEAAMIPQSPPESVLSSMSDLALSSVVSL